MLLFLIPVAHAQTLGSTNILEGMLAGTNSVVLSVTPPNATWTATTNDIWLHLSAANQSGKGSTNVVFTFDANPGATRTGVLIIAGQTLTVTQAGSTYVAANPLTTLVSSNSITPLYSPNGVAVDRMGNVYIADTYDHAIKKWSVANSTVTTLAASVDTEGDKSSKKEGSVIHRRVPVSILSSTGEKPWVNRVTYRV